MKRTFFFAVAILLSCQISVAKDKGPLSLDARALSISCDNYGNGPAVLQSDLFGSGNVEIEATCTVRILVALEGMPLAGLAAESFSVNHFQSPYCSADANGPVVFSDQGSGVYSANLPCEPDDMSVIVSDLLQSVPQNSIVTWVRSYDPYTRTSMASHHVQVRSDLLWIEGELQSQTQSQNIATSILQAIHSVVSSIQDTVDDIASSLP